MEQNFSLQVEDFIWTTVTFPYQDFYMTCQNGIGSYFRKSLIFIVLELFYIVVVPKVSFLLIFSKFLRKYS